MDSAENYQPLLDSFQVQNVQRVREPPNQNDLAYQQTQQGNVVQYKQSQEEHGITNDIIQLQHTNQFHGLIQPNRQLQDSNVVLDLRQETKQQSEDRRQDIKREKADMPILPEPESPAQVWEALRIPEIDRQDLAYIARVAGSLSLEDRDRAEQVVGTQQFKRWMLSDRHWVHSDGQWVPTNQNIDVSGRTMKLLVHGDFDSNDNVSAFSVLCASLTGILRRQTDFISLVFFCGRHLYRDQNPGPLAMIRSLVGQLLQQNPSCPSGLSQNVSMPDVSRGDIPELCKLLGCLIRHLDSTVTVFCMIDGIGLYEREQYRSDMEEILNCILSLAEDEDQGVGASIKLFLTSTQPTRRVRKAFQAGTSLLTMAAVPDFAQGRSPIRFNRQVI
ncbi:hypothetical protein O1611_g6423 [Lasiodiplodia mahajangana]|uniref:Uncharacterized protein n=1 Tax=Lasiodiplodia mahajangana TaxID=1108764 RepID=A0ACC2JIF8_9PEZI|nr:hypothetical protein O1611_g6423 [Lasiodiplodia mahajangana]